MIGNTFEVLADEGETNGVRDAFGRFQHEREQLAGGRITPLLALRKLFAARYNTSAAVSPCVGENRTANTRMIANASRMTPKMANCSTWTPLNHSEITSVSITTKM